MGLKQIWQEIVKWERGNIGNGGFFGRGVPTIMVNQPSQGRTISPEYLEDYKKAHPYQNYPTWADTSHLKYLYEKLQKEKDKGRHYRSDELIRDITRQIEDIVGGTGGGAGGAGGGAGAGGAGGAGAVGGVGAGSGQLAEEIHRQRQEAEAKMEQMYQEAKSSIDAAYEAGLMSETEYNATLTDSREFIEAQTSDLMRRTTEGAYGRVNVGAVRGAARDIEKSRIGHIAAGRRGVIRERGQRQAQAASQRAGGYLDLMSRREIPRYDIPEGFGRGETYTAVTGKPPMTTQPLRPGVPTATPTTPILQPMPLGRYGAPTQPLPPGTPTAQPLRPGIPLRGLQRKRRPNY